MGVAGLGDGVGEEMMQLFFVCGDGGELVLMMEVRVCASSGWLRRLVIVRDKRERKVSGWWERAEAQRRGQQGERE